MTLKINKIKPLLKLEKKEFKYLSPFIYFYNKNYLLFFCNRGKNSKKFYGEINLAKSSNLHSWSKVSFSLKPKGNIISLTSPCIFKKNNFFYLIAQAQDKKKKNFIISFKSVDLIKWKKSNKIKIKPNNSNAKSPTYLNYCGRDLIIFSKESAKKKQIVAHDINSKKKKILLTNCFLNERYSLYGPSLLKIDGNFIMFFSSWKNSKSGGIKIAFGKSIYTLTRTRRFFLQGYGKINIISEPFIIKKDKYLYLFFEYKNEDGNWYLGKQKININQIKNIVK